MKNIMDFVNTLTPEEKELHKELIDECLNREYELAHNNIKENMEKFIIATSNVVEKLHILQTEVEKVANSIDLTYLKSIPNDRCFNA